MPGADAVKIVPFQRERPGDAAYLLIGAQGRRRVVLLSQGLARYDAEFAFVGGIARLPKDNLTRVQWAGNPPGPVDGDGLVIVRDGTQPNSALAIFLQQGRLVMGSPIRFDAIPLR